MASIVNPLPGRTTPGAAPVPVLRDGAKSTTITGTNTDASARPAAVSKTSSSELGVPGTFPRDPRVALDNLSDKAAVQSSEVASTDNGTGILDAARSDIRTAVDAASRFLPQSVVGALGSVLPVGSTDAEQAEKTLDSGSGDVNTSKMKTSEMGEKEKTAMGQNKFTFNPKDLAIGGVVSDNFSPSSRINPTSEKHEGMEGMDTDTPAASPTPVPHAQATGGKELSSTSIPASASASKEKGKEKEKRANNLDTSKDIDALNLKEAGKPDNSDLRKKAIETAALGAGIGTLGGLGGAAAYASSRSPPEKGGQGEGATKSLSQGMNLGGSEVAAPPSGVQDPMGIKSATEGSQPKLQSQDAYTSPTSGADSGKKQKQPAFVTYAPGPVITEDTPFDESESSLVAPADKSKSMDVSGSGKPLSAVPPAGTSINATSTQTTQTGVPQPSSKEDKFVRDDASSMYSQDFADGDGDTPRAQESKGHELGLGAAALGAGAATAGGTAYVYEQSRPPDQVQVGDKSTGTGAGVVEPTPTPATGVPPTSGLAAGSGTYDEKPPQAVNKEAAAAVGAVGVAGTTSTIDKNFQKEQAQREEERQQQHIKEQQKLQKEAGKETKKHEKEVAAPATGGTVASVGAGVAGSKLAKNHAESVPESEKASRQPEEKDTQDLEENIQTAQDPAEATAAFLAARSAERDAKRHSIHDPSTGAGAGAGAGADAGTAVGTGVSSGGPGQSTTGTTTTDFKALGEGDKGYIPHPSIKAASAGPERPGPIALGAARTGDHPKEGADSDFLLPSANASAGNVEAVDISGNGNRNENDLGKGDGTDKDKGTGIVATGACIVVAGAGAGAGVATASTQKELPSIPSKTDQSPTQTKRSSYHPQEKYDGGMLRSSTIEREKKVDEEGKHTNGNGNGNGFKTGNGNGNGKKEGFVRHLVEKVKVKLHHRDK